MGPSTDPCGTPQQARDINIHKLHPFPKKNGLGSADFLHRGTGYVEIAVRSYY